jgi:hypothetical protein
MMRNFHLAAMLLCRLKFGGLLQIFPRAVRRIRGVSLKPTCMK